MPVQLKDAQITVKIVTEEAEQKVDSLEKKVDKTGRDAEREERKERERDRQKNRRQPVVVAASGRGAVGRLAQAATTVLAVGAIIELVIPAVVAFVTEALPDLVQKTGIPQQIRELVDDAVQALVTDNLSRISAAFQAVGSTRSRAEALLSIGMVPTAADILEDVQTEYRVRWALDTGKRAQEKLTRGIIGESLGRAVRDLWR